jgi:hypothetical protein
LLPAPHLEREDPLVQLQAADAERVLFTLVGPGDEPSSDTATWNLKLPIELLLGFLWLAGWPLGLCNLYNPLPSLGPAPPTAIRHELVDAATWRRILLISPKGTKRRLR